MFKYKDKYIYTYIFIYIYIYICVCIQTVLHTNNLTPAAISCIKMRESSQIHVSTYA
jgi:hypothetical protein